MGPWCALIFLLSATPDLHSGLEYDYPLRKLAHMIEYAILFLLSRRAFQGTWAPAPGKPSRAWDAAALVFAVFYAMSDEYHQSFVAGRSGQWADVGIDAIGTVLAALAVTLRRGSRRARY